MRFRSSRRACAVFSGSGRALRMPVMGMSGNVTFGVGVNVLLTSERISGVINRSGSLTRNLVTAAYAWTSSSDKSADGGGRPANSFRAAVIRRLCLSTSESAVLRQLEHLVGT